MAVDGWLIRRRMRARWPSTFALAAVVALTSLIAFLSIGTAQRTRDAYPELPASQPGRRPGHQPVVGLDRHRPRHPGPAGRRGRHDGRPPPRHEHQAVLRRRRDRVGQLPADPRLDGRAVRHHGPAGDLGRAVADRSVGGVHQRVGGEGRRPAPRRPAGADVRQRARTTSTCSPTGTSRWRGRRRFASSASGPCRTRCCPTASTRGRRILVSPDVIRRFTCPLVEVPAGASVEQIVDAVLPEGCARSYQYYSLQLRDGRAGVAAAEAAFVERAAELNQDLPHEERSPGYFLIATTTDQDRAQVARSVQPTTSALAVLGVAAAVLTLVLAGLAIARDLRRQRAEIRQWWRLGLARADRARVVAVSIVLGTTLGVALGALRRVAALADRPRGKRPLGRAVAGPHRAEPGVGDGGGAGAAARADRGRADGGRRAPAGVGRRRGRRGRAVGAAVAQLHPTPGGRGLPRRLRQPASRAPGGQHGPHGHHVRGQRQLRLEPDRAALHPGFVRLAVGRHRPDERGLRPDGRRRRDGCARRACRPGGLGDARLQRDRDPGWPPRALDRRHGQLGLRLHRRPWAAASRSGRDRGRGPHRGRRRRARRRHGRPGGRHRRSPPGDRHRRGRAPRARTLRRRPGRSRPRHPAAPRQHPAGRAATAGDVRRREARSRSQSRRRGRLAPPGDDGVGGQPREHAGVRRPGPATGDHQRRQCPVHPGARRDPVRRGHVDRARDRGGALGPQPAPGARHAAGARLHPPPAAPQRRRPGRRHDGCGAGHQHPLGRRPRSCRLAGLRGPPRCAHRSFDLAARAPRRLPGRRSSSRGWSRCRARPWPRAARSRSAGSDGPHGPGGIR